MEPWGETAQQYRDFAVHASDSPCFVDWATRVADDREVLDWLEQFPSVKRQPNLVFAAARWHGAAAPGPYGGLRAVLRDRADEVAATIRSRATQTNEPGRMATLVPALCLVPGPIALIEVGASAGLCLVPDRHDYDWGPFGELRGSGGPVLRAVPHASFPVPTAHPEISWRGGCDLAPVDLRDPDACAWLENLVWPEQDERRARLRAAIEAARADPPSVVRGDLFDVLPELLAEAGRHGTPVVQHTAVIAYLTPERRAEFDEMMRAHVAAGDCRWLSNESPRVLPSVTATGPEPPGSRFVLGLDGTSVAWTHGHGSEFGWHGCVGVPCQGGPR